jgi:hypothetical protein
MPARAARVQVLDYLAGACSCRKYHIIPPPRAQPMLPKVPRPVSRAVVAADADEQQEAARERRDWKKGVMDRCACCAAALLRAMAGHYVCV